MRFHRFNVELAHSNQQMSMAEAEDVVQETLTPDEETVQETETETAEEVDVEALKKQAQDAIAARERLKAENKELKKQLKSDNQEDTPQDNERYERLELKIDKYSDEEIDFIMQNGGRKSLDNKLVKSAIEAQRKFVKSEGATPSGSGKSPVFQKFTERDLKNMPLEELEKIIPQGE